MTKPPLASFATKKRPPLSSFENFHKGSTPLSIAKALLPEISGYAQKAFGGELEQQKKPLTSVQIASLLAGPLGLVASGRGDVVKEMVAPAGEALTYALPVGRGVKGLAKSGAVAGGILGLTSSKPKTLEERAKRVATGAAIGAGTGAAMGAIGAAFIRVKKVSKPLVTQVFKPLTSRVQKLRRYHNLEFADEVIKNDLPHIKGKSNEDILDYFTDKLSQSEVAVDDYLDMYKPFNVNKGEVTAIMDDVAKLRKGRVLQEGALHKIDLIQQKIKGMPKKIEGITLNQIKRDLQTAAKSFYNTRGNPTATSEALQDAAFRINNLIEKNAPGTKALNSSWAFYRLAKDSIEKRIDQIAKSEGGGLVQQLLRGGGMAGMGYGVASGRPEIVGISSLPVISNLLLRSPGFKTQAATMAEKAGKVKVPELLQRMMLYRAAEQ